MVGEMQPFLAYILGGGLKFTCFLKPLSLSDYPAFQPLMLNGQHLHSAVKYITKDTMRATVLHVVIEPA